jgi:primosomal protein N' (replication factor Y)
MPPFGRLVALIVSGPNQDSVRRVATSLARQAPRADGVAVFGPAPAPLAMLRGRHRMRLLMKTGRRVAVQPLIRDWLARTRQANDVRVQVDVDPYSFF